MAQYTEAQLEQAFLAAGGPAEWAQTMAAVGMAESGGNSDAKNPSGATGPWQTIMSAQGAAFQAKYGHYDLTNLQQAAEVAVAQLAGGSGISNWEADPVGAAAVANGSKPLNAQQLSSTGTNVATLDSAVTTAPAANPNDTALTPSSTFAAPIKGANVKNFHGYDLSAIPTNDLGNAERSIEKYLSDPNYAQQLQTRVSQDYGYSGSWVQKIPELNAVLVWAASNLDLSTAAGKDQFTTAVGNTQWYQTHDANQRTWAQAQATDPAGAHQALLNAQEKVLADANQIGVNLNPAQLSNLANFYAQNTYVQSGSFGTQSGTAPEWLDQAIIDTALNIKNSVGNYSGGVTDLSGATNPTSVTGITSALFQNFQQIAQQYLMYSPGGKGLLTDQQLMGYVDDALKNYTGTGASGQISQFQSDAENQFTQTMKEQASQFYPSLAGAIASGTSPQTYVQPLQSLIGNTLGLDSASINFTDPNWNWAIATPDAKTGQKVALTQDQVLQKITDPSFSFTGPNGQSMTYADTNSAKQMANQFGQQFAAAFGTGA